MNNTEFIKKKNAPENFSTEDINKFKMYLSSISKKMRERSNSAFQDIMTIKEQITVSDEYLLRDYLITHRENKDFITVLQKVRLIDFLYSTNLRMSGSSIYADIANIILKITNFDERIEIGCLDLVSEIAKGIKETTGTNHFSFVTKYCCNHNYHIYNKDDYSIYDTAMNKAIPNYIDVTYTYIDNECRNKMDYNLYHTIVSTMIKEFGIKTEKPRRDTDFYLWYHYR